MAYNGPTVLPGISGQVLNNIPQQWSANWFRQFCLNHLQYADARNALAGANVSISGGIGAPATIAAGVSSIANDTVLGNVSGIPAAPVGLTQAQLTALVEEATTGLSGACPVLSGNSAQFLNGVGAFASPPAAPIGANPSASIGLAAVDGTAATFMTSDSAPALSQAISPTWTGNHEFSPASGVGVLINAASGAYGLEIEGYANTYAAAILASSTNAESFGLVIEAGTTSADVALLVENQGTSATFLKIFGDGHGTLGPNATNGLSWDEYGNVTVAAPSTAAGGDHGALQVTGVADQYALSAIGSSTNAESFGQYISAGTTSADVALYVVNQAASATFLEIFGDGHGTLGSSSTAGIQWTSAGHVTIQNLAVATDVGFYGTTPLAQRATTSTQKTSNLASVTTSASFGTAEAAAFNAARAALQEVMNTLAAYGLWGTS